MAPDAGGLPSWIDRRVYAFNTVEIAGRPRGQDEYFFNPAVFETAAGEKHFLGRYVADGRRELIGLRLKEDLSFASPIASDFSGALRADLPSVTWFADPRHFRYAGRDFITFNNGQNPLPNDIYVVEVDGQGQPISPVFTVLKLDGRQPIEKNWAFFEHAGRLYCVYSLQPFIVLACDFAADKLLCTTAFEHHWYSAGYEAAHGEIHCGTSPVLIDGRWVMIAQSRYPKDHDRVYYATLIAFEDQLPFRPTAFADRSLIALTEDELVLRGARDLNAKLRSCIYPCGLMWDRAADTLSVSYGINDYASGVRTYRRAELLAPLEEVGAVERRHLVAAAPAQRSVEPRTATEVRTFFWNARAAKANPFKYGNVGDQLEELLISRFFGAAPRHDESRGQRLLGVGSISHRMLRGDVLWGTGFRNVPPKLAPGDAETIDVRAVRGPLTLAYLKRFGVSVDRVNHFFDPGLLIGEIFRDQFEILRRRVAKTSTVAFIPHHHDRGAFVQRYGRLGLPIIDVDNGLMNFCGAILSTTLVVASSLHGIILAEALGVPAVMHKPLAGEQIEKFFDYYYGTDRTTFPVVESFADVVAAEPPALPKLKCAEWIATLPTAEDLSAAGILRKLS